MRHWQRLAVLACTAGLVVATFYMAGFIALLFGVTRDHEPRPRPVPAAPAPVESTQIGLSAPVPSPPNQEIERESPAPTREAEAAEEEAAYEALTRESQRQMEAVQERARDAIAQAVRAVELEQEPPPRFSPEVDALRSHAKTAIEQAVRQAEQRAREDD